MRTIQLFYIAAVTVSILGGCSKSAKEEVPSSDTTHGSSTASPTPIPEKPLAEKKEVEEKETGKTYTVWATVTAIDEKNNTLTINHEKMEGYMDAMEMPYAVANPAVFKEVRVGTKGHFSIRVRGEDGEITAVHVDSK
jgi:Cu/Ag efflux protein CusF